MEDQNPPQPTPEVQNQAPTQPPPQSSPPAPNKTSEAHAVIAIILLFFIYPIGLIFMWFATNGQDG